MTSGDDPEAVLRGVVHGGLVEQHGADVRDQKDESFDPALPLLGGEEGAERFRLAVPEERGGEGVDRVLLAQVEAQTLDALLELLRRPNKGSARATAGLPVGVRQVEAQHALPST